jgi:ATP-binding cassette subfamily F protein 3
VLDAVELRLSPGDRIGLLGPNGAGKSTLVKLLAGALTPAAGCRLAARELRIGYFAQHQVEQLDAEASPLLHLQRLDGNAREQDLRDYLGGFGFTGDQALAETGPFSGGEKSRLVLALLAFQRPNLLLLDEPTNHLDLDMRQALAEALQDFGGAVVLVSHDRHLLRVTCDRLLLVNDGRVEEYAGSLDDYPNWLTGWRKRQDAEPAGQAPPRAPSRKEQRRVEAQQRKALQPLTRQLAEIEQRLAGLESTRVRLDENLADPALYDDGNKDRMLALLREKADIDSRIEQDEGEWLRLSEELEALRARNAGV